MAQTRKPRKVKAATPRPRRATTRSTAGVGSNFEDKVAAWLLTKMLRAEPIPGSNAAGQQLQMQTYALGWDIDDLLMSGTADPAGEVRRLAVSCKSNVQVTSSGLPVEFVSAAWRLWRKPEPLHRAHDSLALVTRGLNAAFDAAWSDIKTWCDDLDAAFALAKINASMKHKRIFASVKEPGGNVSNNEDTVALIRQLQVIPLDFQLAPSHTEQNAITHCREMLHGATLQDAGKLWQELLRTSEDSRLRGGTIRLLDLWGALRNTFDLRDHPDFSASWNALAALTSDYKNTIETCLPGGFQIPRGEETATVGSIVVANAVSVVHGNSGCGKSALVKSLFDLSFPQWQQVWLGPEQLDAVLSEVNRGSVGVTKPLLDVLNSTTRTENVLVVDAAERLTPELADKTRRWIAQLARQNNAGGAPLWRVVIVGQTEAWADGRLPALAGTASPQIEYEVREATQKDVRGALRSLPSLAWLALQDEAVTVLANLRALAWVMRAEAAFGAQSVAGINSLAGIADRLWRFWTSGEARFQNLMMRLAEREASFERSFALSQMAIADAEAFDDRPPQCPLRLNAKNRIEFEHDLAADWARFQLLKEIADDTAKWTALAINPLWAAALRMLGQFLLRKPVEGRTAWDVAFASVENSKEAPLSADVLLDALCLDPLAEKFLNERLDLLLENSGARLNRLLRRFHHIATFPGVPAEFLKVTPGLLLYFEAQYRTPIVGRWLRVAKFLLSHQKRVANLMSPVVAGICETWLVNTPYALTPGVAMPFRKQFAETALATARAVQISQGSGVIFLDDSEKPIYSAALSGATDIPDKVAEWALELARRRPYRSDVSDEINAFRQDEMRKRTDRLRTDTALREREANRRIEPTFLPSRTKLSPWPSGPSRSIDKAFHECCTHTHALTQLMSVRPHIAAEVLLATIIEAPPEESCSSRPRHDWELGLAFDPATYPTGYWKSRFFQFLQIDDISALRALLDLVTFCTERWEYEWNAPEPPQTTIILHDGTRVVFKGDAEVFDWSQSNSMRTGQLKCALAALERWLCMQIDKEFDVSSILSDLLQQSTSVALLGVLVNVGKYRPALFSGPLRALLGNPDLYLWDDIRVDMLKHHFDSASWAQAGEQIFEMAKQWTFAQYRRLPLRALVRQLIITDATVATFVADSTRTWQPPAEKKAGLEFRMLVAELNRKNYAIAAGERAGTDKIHFRYPSDLQRDISQYEQATLPKLQALYLPDQCEKLLVAPKMLTSAEAQELAAAMDSASADEDEETRRLATSAAACALSVKASIWLNENPVVRDQVNNIITKAIETIGETLESFRHPTVFMGRGDLKFSAHAVIHRWISAANDDTKWESLVLKIITSRDGPAVETMVREAYENRGSLGSKWYRLLQLGIFWAGLLVLAPTFEDSETVGHRWTRWLRTLRTFRLNDTNVTASAIAPLGIARRVEKLEQLRWKRAQATAKSGGQRLPHRYSSGLDTQLLEQLFSWLLRQSQQELSTHGGEFRRLLEALWSFEAWRRYEDLDTDGAYRTPSTFAYAVLESLAVLIPSTAINDARTLWMPVLSMGSDAHYSIGHLIRCFFLKGFGHQDSAAVGTHWRLMLEYALEAPNWTEGRQWFYGEQLLRRLLGFGYEATICQAPNFQAIILSMRDLYEKWARKHLGRDDDNVTELCGFLASGAGAPIRLDGLLWIDAFVRSESSTVRWHRGRIGSALVELVDVIVSQGSYKVAAEPEIRDALIYLAAYLAAKQVPASLALQERILRMH